ncbi:MAG: FAD-dependent oxidoreductase [Haliea sp.]|jgi:protoporphyrinogen oxidase|nr:FAD-dependent oxidoreductase [Haliea sp.]
MNTLNTKEHVVILGAGPAGLATGHELSVSGVRVSVIDRNSFVGGLCNTNEHRGYKFDLGGHRWFTKNEDLNSWFRRLMGSEIVWVERISRIYYDGAYYSYPISILNVVKNAGIGTIVHAGVTYLLSALQYSLLNKPIRNMKDAYVAQFGGKLYDMFFRRYSEKVWGLPCEKLSSDWVSQRSAGLSIWTVIQESLLRTKSDNESLIEEFMYPRDGYVRIPQRMAEDIVAKSSTNAVMLDSNVTKIKYHGPHNFEVTYCDTDGRETSVAATTVVSTIPLGVLPRIMEPACDQSVIDAAKGLTFRALITVNVILRKERVSIDTWLYIQDEDILFGRMHEPKNWSSAMVPDQSTTSLVLECFCTKDDHIWSMSDEEVGQRCIEDLEKKLKFIDSSEVIDFSCVRTLQAYPVYDLEYAEKIAVINGFLAGFEGLHIVGRGGTHRYNNADHSIEMGLLLGRKILGYDVDYMDVNTEPEYHEIKCASVVNRDYYVLKEELN